MYKKRLFETAEALVYDPVAANRNATRASLHSVGFRNVELAASLDSVRDALNSGSPDLLVAEVAGSEADVCNLIQSVRQETLGTNPFGVMVITTWRRDGTIVTQVLNSGADDLIARPFSTTQLGERIKSLVERRKGFVVTHDYIGPDRRRDPSRSGAECFPVPNSLQVRALDGVGEEEAHHRIAHDVAQGKAALNGRRLHCDAVQLLFQWRMFEQRQPQGRDFSTAMTRIEKLGEEIKRRSAASKNETAVQLSDAVLKSVQAINAMRNDVNVDTLLDVKPPLQSLGQAVASLAERLAPGQTLPAHLFDGGSGTRRPAA